MIKTAAALFSAILILCATAFAQAPAQKPPDRSFGTAGMEGLETISPNGQRTTTVVMTPGSSCPVAMQAKQRGLGAMVKTKRTPPQDQPDAMPGPAQHIHLILTGFAKDKHIRSATVTARGLSARSRIQNTNLVSNATSDLRRTLEVTFTPEEDGTVSADLDLPAFTSVSSLQLGSITYSDGSSWKPANQNACTVTPDPMMMIGLAR